MSENPQIHQNTQKKKKKKRMRRYRGKVKWLDSLGIGYIVSGDNEFLMTPLSCSPNTAIKEGYLVDFSIRPEDSKSGPLEAVNVIPLEVECYYCDEKGHYCWECPDFENPYWSKKCYKCGLKGHFAVNCDQKLKGWFGGGKKKILTNYSRCCDSWVCLFGVICSGAHVGSVSVGPSEKRVVVDDDDGGGGDDDHDDDDDGGGGGDDDDHDDDDDGGGDDDDDDHDDDDDGGGDDDDGEVRYVVCVRREEDVKKVEEVEDCFILEFDPCDLNKFSNLSLCDKSQVVGDDDDVCILAEKGQVACRDYPHARHLCANHPFKETLHETHCKMCYCYICDLPAPCKKWINVSQESYLNHCDATDDIPYWKLLRDLEKKGAVM